MDLADLVVAEDLVDADTAGRRHVVAAPADPRPDADMADPRRAGPVRGRSGGVADQSAA